jgi:hypothetical protein
LRVRNTGNECVLKSFYDVNEPLGLSVTKGKIIEKAELISTSNEYIRRNLKIIFDSTGQLSFSDVILEPNEFYTLKLLILHVKGQNPIIHPKGKIAGIKNIPVISMVQETKGKKSFLHETFGGDIVSQFVRAVSYPLVVIAIIMFIAFGVDSTSERIKRSRRIQIVKDFKKEENYTYSKMDDAIFIEFIEEGQRNFYKYLVLLKDAPTLNKKYNEWITRLTKSNDDEKAYTFFDNQLQRYRIDLESESFNELIDGGFVIKNENELIINQQMKHSLSLFITYLKKIGYKEKEVLSNETVLQEDSLC